MTLFTGTLLCRHQWCTAFLCERGVQFLEINWIIVFRSCFLVMFLAYPGVSLKVLRVFKCRDIAGVSYLEADMRLQVIVRGVTQAPGPCCGTAHRQLIVALCALLCECAVLHKRVGRLRHLQFDHCCSLRHRSAVGYVPAFAACFLWRF
jgi:hypothetical protein